MGEDDEQLESAEVEAPEESDEVDEPEEPAEAPESDESEADEPEESDEEEPEQSSWPTEIVHNGPVSAAGSNEVVHSVANGPTSVDLNPWY